MSDAAHVWADKHPDAELDYAVDFESECARTWSKWTDFSQNTRIRYFGPGHGAGFQFSATTAGRSGGRMPAFASVSAAGQAVRDGGVVWTSEAISSDSLVRTISGTPTWAADAGITIANETIEGMVAIADIAGGDAGQDYSVTVVATMSDGNDVVKVCILPVRIPVRE